MFAGRALRFVQRGTFAKGSAQGILISRGKSFAQVGSILGGSYLMLSQMSTIGWKAHCYYQAEPIVVSEYKPKKQEEPQQWNLNTVFSLIWQAIKESPFLTLSTIISGILSALVPLLIPRASVKFLEIAQEPNCEVSHLIRPTIELLSIGITAALLNVAEYWQLTSLMSRIHSKLSTTLFESYLRQDVSFFDARETADLITRLDADVDNVVRSLKHTFSSGLRNSVTFIGGTVSLFIMSPQLAILMYVTLPAMIGVGWLYSQRLRRLSKEAKEEHTKVVGTAHETISLIRTVRAFAAEGEELDKFVESSDNERRLFGTLGRGIAILQGLTLLAYTGVVSTVLGYGGYLIVSGELTSGVISNFLFQSFQLQKSLMEFAKLGGEYSRATSSVERVNDLLASHPTIPLKGGLCFAENSVTGDIEFHHVDFRYPTRPDQKVIDDLSLKIPAGKTVAIVGRSGSGKSTLLALIERFYDVNRGTVLLDGMDIKNLDPSWLRKQIGIVSQEPVLFDASIYDNIKYGAPDATLEQVEDACRRANCHNFISHFEQGYDTPVGERGVQLSGGQKQRIAIARALLTDPKILILDEATSSLDTESEHVVQEALTRAMKGRTVIVVAHRLSTIKRSDNIVVLQDGKIVEQGTHHQLMSLRGIYAELVQAQEKE